MLALAVASSVTGPSQAQERELSAVDKETARNLLDQGDKLFEAGDHAAALEKYRAADDIMSVPTTGIEVGRALEALGRLVEARDVYLRVLRYPRRDREASAFTKARARADERARDLAGRIPRLTIVVEGAEGTSPEVKVDGVALNPAILGQPLSVDPGERRIEIAAAGRIPAVRSVTLAEGAHEKVTLELAVDPQAVKPPTEDVPPPIPSPVPARPPARGDDDGGFPVFATIGFSIGAAGLIVGAITGGLSLAKTADLEEPCGEDKSCPFANQSDIDEAELYANVSNVGFAVGGAGVLFGLIALFTLDAEAPAETTAITLTPLVGPGSLGLRGRF